MLLTSKAPYVCNAVYDWIIKQRDIPYIIIDASVALSTIPLAYIKDGVVVLNISPAATDCLNFNDTSVSFSTRFNGIPYVISLPYNSLVMLYGQDSMEGIKISEFVNLEIASKKYQTSNAKVSNDSKKSTPHSTGNVLRFPQQAPKLTLVP